MYLYSTSSWTHVDTKLTAQNFFRPWKKNSDFVDGRIFFYKEVVNKMTSTLSNNQIEDVIKNFLFAEDYCEIT